jgi:hypothetical protein
LALYQLFFHLGTLPAGIVDQVSLAVGGGTAWRLLRCMYAGLAWLTRGPAALVQFAMLLLVLFGAAASIAPNQQQQVLAAASAFASIVFTGLAARTWLRGASPAARWAKLVALLALGRRSYKRNAVSAVIPCIGLVRIRHAGPTSV